MVSEELASGRGAAPGLLKPQSRPHSRDVVLLFVGVLCGSSAPPLMAALAVPALAIAFWRNAMALVLVWPVALIHDRRGFRAVRPRLLLAIAFAAAMLAVHFTAMATALQYTSVASAAALICSQSIWAALFSRLLGERLPGVAWAGTLLALTGVVMVTGIDVSLSPDALVGDALAVLAGMAGGAYMVTGGVVRREVGVNVYTALCYSLCALFTLIPLLITGQDLGGYAPVAWVQLIALTVLAQLLGHGLFNLVMRSVSPSLVSLGQLFTVPIAAVLAAGFLGQVPPIAVLPAVCLMLAGTALVVLSHRRQAAEAADL
jgi:drug/metabolite transporter (DMT)-like permease